MTSSISPVIYLSGAGGGAPDFSVFRECDKNSPRFELVGYPGWKRYVAEGFSASVLIEWLAEQIDAKVPSGPICIVGLSIGGHFGYAIALRLQEMGREIGGFCAIDAFMVASSRPSPKWKGRAAAEVVELVRGRRYGEFLRFLRSRFWRALARLAGGRLPGLLRRLASSDRSSLLSALDPIFEEELNMRLLIETAAPWIASLDQKPVALMTPAILLRTALTDGDDNVWRSRCPNIKIFEIPGQHHTLFEPENVGALRKAFLAATCDW
jgi:thioesterase domain-containing protein